MFSRTVAVIIGAVIGMFLTAILLTQLGPSPAPPPASTGAPELTLLISRDVFVREANRRVEPVLRDYDLRDPQWELRNDNSIILNAARNLPGPDMQVRITMQPVVQNGALAVDIVSVGSGLINLGAGPFDGVAEDVNKELATLLERDKYEVQSVKTTPEGVTLGIKVLGEL